MSKATFTVSRPLAFRRVPLGYSRPRDENSHSLNWYQVDGPLDLYGIYAMKKWARLFPIRFCYW